MKKWVHIVRDRYARLPAVTASAVDEHLAAAADWLARAQDVGDDDGVAAWYDLPSASWKASYPETTGYIIPTLYDYASYSGRNEFHDRAERMAAWEIEVQLEGGGVRAGTLDAETVTPTIFNTGQVLFGWARAWKETRDPRFRDALARGAGWLAKVQDEDGAWRRFSSPFAARQIDSYNTRSAFGLARAGKVLDQPELIHAAQINVGWVLARAHPNGWLEDNCLNDNSRPLTHTIGYSIRGILEVGVIAQRPDLLQAAERMARAVAAAQRKDGALPGRLDRDWAPAVSWSCVTGNAQMAVIWFRLAELVGDRSLRRSGERANRFNMAVQDLSARDPGVRGGIKGSHPIDGEYMRFRYPNWAAKFFMDALMFEQGVDADQ